MKWVDSHAHLTMLEHSPLPEILERSRRAGVQYLISVSTDETNWEGNRLLAEQDADVYYTLGLHPHEASRWEALASRMEKYFEKGIPPKCVGIGELGLDYFHNHSSKEDQFIAFEAQIQLAQDVGLPVVIHCRDAFDDLFSILKRMKLKPPTGVMHCFTGNAAQANQAVDLGLMISFSGVLTFKNAEPLREAAKTVPLDHVLVETDCPYLAPVPFRGKPNEPALVVRTAETLAALRGIALEELSSHIVANSAKLFKISAV